MLMNFFQKCSKTFKNIQKHSKTFKNIQKYSKIFKNIQKCSKMFKNVQHYSDLSHASSGAGKQGKCSESCFLIFLQEKECGK